jgi:hypothetical protein
MAAIVVPQTTPLLLSSEYLAITKHSDELNLLIEASAALQRYCWRRFDERRDTLTFCQRTLVNDGDLLDATTLLVDEDLKSINTLATNVPATATQASDGTVIAVSGYVIPRARRNPGAGVRGIDKIALINDTFIGSGTPADLQGIWIDGLWGHGGQWVNATTLNGAIADSSATSFTATASHGLEQGMVVKIDSEYLFVREVVTNAITVSRGYNGSTAAAHSNGAAVSYWQADDQVRGLVRRLCQWAVEQIKSPVAGAVTIGDFSYPVDTAGLPKDLHDAINRTGLRRIGRIVGLG